jgi:molecular chaperone GrpE
MKKRKQQMETAASEEHQEEPAEIPSEHAHDAEHQYPEPEAGADELTRVKQERDKHYEQLQRALADLQNFRKRRAQEMADARQGAVEGVTAELLPILDSFHLATDAAGETEAVREGLLMVKAMLESVLERHGLREVPAEGQAFDHTVHEAVGLAENSDLAPGQVAEVVQKGYFLGDRVLRHAKVLVSGNMPPGEEGD